MIFAIILIAVFIAFAFFGIKKFLVIQEQVKYVQFAEYLQTDVNTIWKGAQASKKVEYLLPSRITEICFENKEKNNLIFNTKDPDNHDFKPKTIEHLDSSSMFIDSEEICIPNKDGTVSMHISKDYSQNLVTISR